MTFTFSALVGGAKLVLEDPSSTSLEKEQATFLLMLALRATTAETPNEVVEFLSITSLSTSWITRYEVPKDMHD